MFFLIPSYFLSSLEPRISQSVKELGDILLGIKGGGQITGTAPRGMVNAEADEVLRPLMDLLDGEDCCRISLRRCTSA